MKVIKRIIQVYLQFSFRRKLMLALIVISCFMAAYMGVTSYNLSSNIIYDMGKRLSENNINVIHGLLNDYFQSAQDNLTQVTRLPMVRDLLERKNIRPDEEKQLTNSLGNAIRETLYVGSSNTDMNLHVLNFFFKNGFEYTSMTNNEFPYHDYESCHTYFLSNGYITDEAYIPTTWCESRALKDNLGRVNQYIIGIRMLYDSVTLEKLGMMVFAINEADLHKLYSSFSSSALIMHNNGKLLSGSDKSLLGKEFQDQNLRDKILESRQNSASISYKASGKEQLISFKQIGGNNAYFIVPFDYYTGLQKKDLEYFTRASMVIAFVGIAVGILFAFFMSKGLSSSILSLKKVVQKVSEGNLNARFAPRNNDEIAYLGIKFNDALDQINSLFKIQEQDAYVKRNLELRLMQSQINPHLLYNTLDSVIWSLKRSDTPKAQELILSLSNFFKITLSGGNVLIPLESELKMIYNYINIQNLGRDQNITLDVQIPLELRSHKIIKLTLQPMVENSIIHGFSGYREDGFLTIGAQIDGNIFVLWVEDNGIGLLPEDLAKINTLLSTYPPEPQMKHFGLYNVNRRIKNIFGDEYGFYMESELGDYTKTIIKIPYNPEGGNNLNV